jgi:hypothetical protein
MHWAKRVQIYVRYLSPTFLCVPAVSEKLVSRYVEDICIRAPAHFKRLLKLEKNASKDQLFLAAEEWRKIKFSDQL